jgi:beta-glucosidase
MPDQTHLDATLDPHQRADLLARQMTTVEKCYQLTAVPPWWMSLSDGSDPVGLTDLLAKAPGHVCNFAVDEPSQFAEIVGRIQRVAVERTRLQVPILFHSEALNGFMTGGHTVFPTPIGLSATWSPELVRTMAETIQEDMRRVGARQALSPVMDVALDPRWGRVHETYGEDPYLVAVMSVAYTRGLQGDDLAHGVIATAKHFLAYGLPQGGINLSSVELGRRAVRDTFAFPFEAAIQVAGLRSIMNSYSDLDGVPVGASREVLTDLLRGVLGFDGFVTSDYTTLEHLVTRQRVARDAAEAGRLAISAGLDVENPVPYGYGDTLAAEVERGKVDPRDVEASVRRVLRAKFELGLFENPYPPQRIELPDATRAGAGVSEELARRSVVLASNSGILPLTPGAPDVAVIGPHADAASLQFPTYTYPAFREMTLFMSSGGLGNMVGVDPGMAAWNSALLPAMTTEQFVKERGHATSLADEIAHRAKSVHAVKGCTLTTDLDEEEIAAAVASAREADVVVLALGGASLWFGGERTEGEASDTADIALPAAQVRLAEAVAATGTPVVVVLVQGRPYALPDVLLRAEAIVVATFAGPYGPRGVAEVLFGQTNPSGKLPYSVPRHGGQVPVYHHQKAGSGYHMALPPGVDRHYLDMPATPLWQFGHGLSYTTFELSDLVVEPQISTFEAIHPTVIVTNTGSRAGATVVQLYLRMNSFGVTRPAQQLLGFARVDLKPGESQRVTFTVDATQFGHTNLTYQFGTEPATGSFFLGFDAHDHRLTADFEVVGEPRILGSSQRVFFTDVQFEEIEPAIPTPSGLSAHLQAADALVPNPGPGS